MPMSAVCSSKRLQISETELILKRDCCAGQRLRMLLGFVCCKAIDELALAGCVTLKQYQDSGSMVLMSWSCSPDEDSEVLAYGVWL